VSREHHPGIWDLEKQTTRSRRKGGEPGQLRARRKIYGRSIRYQKMVLFVEARKGSKSRTPKMKNDTTIFAVTKYQLSKVLALLFLLGAG